MKIKEGNKIINDSIIVVRNKNYVYVQIVLLHIEFAIICLTFQHNVYLLIY